MKFNCNKVFKNGPSKICGRQPLKNLKEFFKGCFPQILLGPFLNIYLNCATDKACKVRKRVILLACSMFFVQYCFLFSVIVVFLRLMFS